MKSTQYLALLRGINVGGKNIIRMTDLRDCFENNGFNNVLTYIQSGNVIFSCEEKDMSQLTHRVETMLSERFNYASKIVLVSFQQLSEVVSHAPDHFGSDPKRFKYDVIFVATPLTVDEAINCIKTREGVDRVYPGAKVLYYSRLASKSVQSYLSKQVGMPVYKNLTIRNWNTTSKLLQLMAQNRNQA